LVGGSSSLSDLKDKEEELVRDLSQLDYTASDGESLKEKDVLIVSSQFAEGEYLMVFDPTTKIYLPGSCTKIRSQRFATLPANPRTSTGRHRSAAPHG
jgi:hypothetical protein